MKTVAAGAFALLIVVLAVLGGLLAASYQSQAVPTDDFTENTTVTINYSETYDLGPDDANKWYDDEVVKAEDGTLLEEDKDYTWETSNGTLEFFDTSRTTEGNNATVNFTYGTNPPEQETVEGFIGSIGFVAGMFVLVVGGLVIVGGVVGFVRTVGSSGPGRGGF